MSDVSTAPTRRCLLAKRLRHARQRHESAVRTAAEYGRGLSRPNTDEGNDAFVPKAHAERRFGSILGISKRRGILEPSPWASSDARRIKREAIMKRVFQTFVLLGLS